MGSTSSRMRPSAWRAMRRRTEAPVRATERDGTRGPDRPAGPKAHPGALQGAPLHADFR